MSPALDFALLSWSRRLDEEKTNFPTVKPQTISSILGALEKWSIIPAMYILVGGQRRAIDLWGAGIYTLVRTRPGLFVCSSISPGVKSVYIFIEGALIRH